MSTRNPKIVLRDGPADGVHMVSETRVVLVDGEPFGKAEQIAYYTASRDREDGRRVFLFREWWECIGTVGLDRSKRAHKVQKMSPIAGRRLQVASEPVPVADDEPASEGGGRGLLHLDGKSEPRPPKEWEDKNSALTAAEWVTKRDEINRELRAARERMDPPERLAAVLREIGRVGQPRAVQIRETDARGAQEMDTAPRGGDHDALGSADSDEVLRRRTVILLQIAELERIVDQHRGLIDVNYALLSKEEKDALIIGPVFRGITEEELSALLPVLGVPRHIRRVRSDAGQTGRGWEKPKREAA